jgi:hypothetical protein
MSIQAIHHAPYRSTVLAATATALVIGGLAAAGFALSSSQDSDHPVPPAQVTPQLREGLQDFTAPGEAVDGGSPLVGLHHGEKITVRRSAPVPRG